MVVTSRFLCLLAQFENLTFQSFRKTRKVISSTTVKEMVKNFPKFDRGLPISSPLNPREKKEKKEEPPRFACLARRPRQASSSEDDKI